MLIDIMSPSAMFSFFVSLAAVVDFATVASACNIKLSFNIFRTFLKCMCRDTLA